MIPHSQITAQVLRSLCACPGAKKIWECPEGESDTVVTVGSLKIGANHIKQLVGGVGVERLRMLIGIY